jgi:type VI secretion system protein ImpA
MSTAATIDIDALLQPISDEKPGGRSLAYEPDYDQMREARRSEDDAPQGDWQRATKLAEWDRVIQIGTECLRKKSKDLQVAAWLTEAFARSFGFAGIRDGLRLMAALQDRYWESYYPAVDDGDLESRWGPFEFLNNDKLLPLIIRSIALTNASGEKQYSFVRWQESRATDNAAKKSPDLLQSLIAEGKIGGEQFDEAVRQTSRRFYETLSADLSEATEAFKALDSSTDSHFGRDAPGLSNVRKALDDVRKWLDPVVVRKRIEEPDAETAPRSAEEPTEVSSESAGSDESVEPESTPAPAAVRITAARSRPATGPIGGVEDARARIAEAAAYLRQNEPRSPAAYLVVRALRMGELYAEAEVSHTGQLPSPTSETRQLLKRLCAAGDWEQLLNSTEQALASPEGRAWLDPHRYSLMAMSSSSSPDPSTASKAVKSWIRMILTDFPSLASAELRDDTPAANSETRAWIQAEILGDFPQETQTQTAPSPVLPSFEVRSPSSDGEQEPDAWELALADVRSGRIADGIQRVRRAVASASSGREKFLRKLQLAELCLMVGSHRVALPLLEELARVVDDFRLEQWEDEGLCARVWGALYRCLKAQGTNGTSDRLEQVYTRLCRLDIGQAMSYGND